MGTTTARSWTAGTAERTWAAGFLVAVLLAVLLCPAAMAQNAPAPAAPPAAGNPPAGPAEPADTIAPPAPPPVDTSPLGAVGHFIDRSVSGIADGFKATGKAIGDATAPARDAAGAVIRLPAAGFVSGDERCTIAPNGAPDCRAAADALCRAKGFQAGRSLDTQTRYCLPQASAGAPLRPGDCVYVTRALCQ